MFGDSFVDIWDELLPKHEWTIAHPAYLPLMPLSQILKDCANIICFIIFLNSNFKNILLKLLSLFRLWDRCGESCSTGSSLPLDCDPAYAPPSSAAAAAATLGSAPTDEAGRRSDSLPLEARPGGSLTGQASMCSQTSQPIMPPKPPPSSFATIASRLAPQDSVDKSPRLSLSSVKSQHSKELPVKARVCCRIKEEIV